MDYTKLASIIDKAVRRQINIAAPRVRLGTVDGVAGATASVLLDGSASAAAAAKGCPCSQGDRVIVLCQGTQLYAIAKVGGDGT